MIIYRIGQFTEQTFIKQRFTGGIIDYGWQIKGTVAPPPATGFVFVGRFF